MLFTGSMTALFYLFVFKVYWGLFSLKGNLNPCTLILNSCYFFWISSSIWHTDLYNSDSQQQPQSLPWYFPLRSCLTCVIKLNKSPCVLSFPFSIQSGFHNQIYLHFDKCSYQVIFFMLKLLMSRVKSSLLNPAFNSLQSLIPNNSWPYCLYVFQLD